MTIILDKSSRYLAAGAAAAAAKHCKRRAKKREDVGEVNESDAVLYWFLTTELTVVSFT
jgi:hypothetical protein